MGKPEDFDPRVDASVRVQVGKLRQRLESYYLNYAQNQLIAASRKQTQLTPWRPRAVTFVTGQN